MTCFKFNFANYSTITTNQHLVIDNRLVSKLFYEIHIIRCFAFLIVKVTAVTNTMQLVEIYIATSDN